LEQVSLQSVLRPIELIGWNGSARWQPKSRLEFPRHHEYLAALTGVYGVKVHPDPGDLQDSMRRGDRTITKEDFATLLGCGNTGASVSAKAM
jgi:hypothetical protein